MCDLSTLLPPPSCNLRDPQMEASAKEIEQFCSGWQEKRCPQVAMTPALCHYQTCHVKKIVVFLEMTGFPTPYQTCCT